MKNQLIQPQKATPKVAGDPHPSVKCLRLRSTLQQDGSPSLCALRIDLAALLRCLRDGFEGKWLVMGDLLFHLLPGVCYLRLKKEILVV
jgi:hypothetical protein